MKARLQRVWDKVIELWYNPYYVWLYWSQNYWTDSETSDFDFKCIILPTLDDLVYQTKPVSTDIEFEWWLIDIKDIRTYIESAVKVNVNFIEIMTTDYCLWAPEIRVFFKPLLDELWNQYLRACLWMINMKYKALSHPYPSKEYEIKTFWYDPKQLMHIVRLRLLMERYINWNYSLFHDKEERKLLLEYKSWNYTLLEAEKISEKEIQISEQIINSYTKEDTYKTKQKMIDFSRYIIRNNIIKNGK